MNNHIYNYRSVARLDQILNYQISTAIIFAISFFFGIALLVIIVAALIFTPYMIYVLYNEKRYEFIISFGILIISPILFFLVIGALGNYTSIALLISLLLFYLYCFFLKYTVREWIREYSWTKKLEEQRIEREENKKLWERQFREE